MIFKTFTLAVLFASALAAPTEDSFTCRIEPPSDAMLAIAQGMQNREGQSDGSRLLVEQSIEVDVYFHVVSASDSVDDGNVPDSQLQNQLSVLNDKYAAHSIQFTLKGTDRTTNATWADDGDDLGMKKALRKGSYSALNIYFLRSLGGDAGFTYFPKNTTEGSDDFYRDGCDILSKTVPGGSATNYNQGYTTVHEVGHWFGLFHTFQGDSCTGAGDYISDTPQQSTATSGCPTNKDSCPDVDGLDAVHNYMDYSYDSCYEEFTAGQHARMYSMWSEFRAPKTY